jgi:hypothetical protein
MKYGRSISKSGGAGMIGGVRSPMAAPSHGLVGKKTDMRISGASKKSGGIGPPTAIRSPQESKDNV